MCFSRFGVESLFLCLRVYCERGSSGEEGLRGLNETCVGYGAELPGFEAVVEGFTDEDVVRMRHLGREEAMRATVANGTVIPGERLFGLSFETLVWDPASLVMLTYCGCEVNAKIESREV